MAGAGEQREEMVTWSLAGLFILASWAIRSLYFHFGAVGTTEEFKAGSDMIRYAENGLEMTRVEKRPVRQLFQNFRQEMVLAVLGL